VQALYRSNKPSFVVRQDDGLVSAGERLFFGALDGKGISGSLICLSDSRQE